MQNTLMCGHPLPASYTLLISTSTLHPNATSDSKLATFLNKVHTLQWQMSLGPNDIFIRPWQFAILIMR